MSFEIALREELTAVSGLENKLFPSDAPEDTPSPYVVYDSSEGVQDKSLDGYLSSKAVECALNVVCSSYKALKTLSPEVIQRLLSFEQRTIGVTAPVFVQELRLDGNSMDFYDPDIQMYRCVIEFTAYL